MRRAITGIGLLISVLASAQIGPGGVGDADDLMIWLTGDHGTTVAAGGVSAWSDRLGNGRVAVQANSARRPQYIAEAFNGYPALLFDDDISNADRLIVADHPSLSGDPGMTAFSVFDLNSGTDAGAPRAIFSKRNGVNDDNAYAWFHWNGGSGSTIRQYFDLSGTANRLTGTVTYSPGTALISSLRFEGNATPNDQRQRLFRANDAAGNKTINVGSVPVTNADLYIGSLNGHPGSGASTTRFNGHIAEVIMYGVALNESQRIIVNNYLAAKYGLALSAFDLYTMDEPANGDHDHDVAGIGRLSASDLHLEARGTGIVHISNASDLDNGEFLHWGHDNAPLGVFGETDLPSGVAGRFHRVWRVSELHTSGVPCDVGTVDIAFDLTSLGPVDEEHLRLLVDLDGDGFFSNETPIAGAVHMGNGLYRFEQVDALSHGMRFTLGSTDLVTTPLPVELLWFDAHAEQRSVQIEWATASETNSDRFDVQRSVDAVQWTTFTSLAASGESQTMLHYTCRDTEPLPGRSYYRMVQVDLDASVAYSPIVPVFMDQDPTVTLYPMPFNDGFHVICPEGELKELTLVDAMGRAVHAPWQRSGSRAWVDVSGLSPGQYVLRLATEMGHHQRQVLKAH